MERKCEFIEQNIIDFVYGEIADHSVTHEIHEHIKGCEHCTALVKQYKEIAKTAHGMKVDFSKEVWDMHAKQVMGRLEREKFSFGAKVIKALSGLFEVRRLGYAMLMLLVIGAGVFFVKSRPDTDRGRMLTEKVEFFENMEIIERLDFYTALSETEGLQGPGNSF